MPRRSTPEERNSVIERERVRVRRRYKASVARKKKIIPGEREGIVMMVCVLKLAGYNHTQISKIIGISRGQVSEIVSEPATAEYLTKLRHQIPQAALELLQSYLIEAIQAIVDVMRSSDDDQMILKAAAEILDRAGVPKASRSEASVHKTEEHKTTFTDDGIVDALRQASPETQEEAAQLIERLESLLNKDAEVKAEAEE
jgi:hypothetical protein